MDCLLDENLRALDFLLETGDEIVRPVLEEHDEAEGEEDEKQKPEKRAKHCHGRRLTDCLAAVNDPEPTFPDAFGTRF